MINIGYDVKGFIKVTDIETNEVVLDTCNQIHYENLSEALANSLANRGKGQLYAMAFGNGGSSVSQTGVITYYPPNVTGQNAALYSQIYTKIIDDTSVLNTNAAQNKMSVLHTAGKVYTDIQITCTLGFGEPSGQPIFDNGNNLSNDFMFDEIGLLGVLGTDSTGATSTRLLSHAVFHPIQKSLNRQYQVVYTVRIAALTNQVTI